MGEQTYGGLLFYIEDYQFVPRTESFINALSSNLKTVNLKTFSNHEGIYM